MNKPILHLNLKRKWFDMIRSGEKTVEYRALSTYWRRFIYVNDYEFKNTVLGHYAEIYLGNKAHYAKDILILFSNGYAKNRKQYYAELKDITVGEGNPEWGAAPGQKYFCFHLGKIMARSA